MRKGIVILIDPVSDKGYIVDENEQDIPFFISSLTGGVEVGDRVTFEIKLSKSGLTAVSIAVYVEQPAKDQSLLPSPLSIYISKESPE
ncbi:cold-shock protein [Pedobacter sp. BMA]|uniref:cold-shock protein n=1 Tax=Pedobacter sp. BMA TaxID=1663685 RepID=UPI00064A089A|nr:hypothetical protein [Pedobacter sp. BMA]KLT63769.1 hypothetical protein AB669_20200 [Pedobacter sp. BMA]